MGVFKKNEYKSIENLWNIFYSNKRKFLIRHISNYRIYRIFLIKKRNKHGPRNVQRWKNQDHYWNSWDRELAEINEKKQRYLDFRAYEEIQKRNEMYLLDQQKSYSNSNRIF